MTQRREGPAFLGPLPATNPLFLLGPIATLAKHMPNGADLRRQKVWGWRLVFIAGIALTFEPLLVIFGWAMLGPVGLAVAVLVLNMTLVVVVWSLQDQISAIDMAIRGVRDESDYSDDVKKGLRRLRGVK